MECQTFSQVKIYLLSQYEASIVCVSSNRAFVSPRAVNILPNRVIGSVGQHPGESIEQIVKSREGHFLASCAHDEKVKFWDVSNLHTVIVDDYRKRKKSGKLESLSKKAFGYGPGSGFFADLAEESVEGEENSKSDDETFDA